MTTLNHKILFLKEMHEKELKDNLSGRGTGNTSRSVCRVPLHNAYNLKSCSCSRTSSVNYDYQEINSDDKVSVPDACLTTCQEENLY
jgi:hypothetical protein